MTALLVWRFTTRLTTRFGAITAACAYLIWLNFMEGEGEGEQAPVFFNLPMIAAAMLVEQAVRRRVTTLRSGLLPMLLVGVAIQI